MAAVPVVLRMSGVAPNYNVYITVTTPGVVWTMGDGGDDCLGISFNALTLDSKRTCGIQRIAFTGSTLAICTGPTAGSDFELTAFIDIPDGTQWLQGFCILNEKASISARLGDLDPVEWRNEINCEIPIMLPEIHRATFLIRGCRQGQSIRLCLTGDGSAHGRVLWSVAPLGNPDIGLRVRSAVEGASVPIATFRADAEQINLTISSAQKGPSASGDLIIEAYIHRIRECRYCPPLAHVRMKIECDESVEATVRVGNHLPQYLATAYKLFAV